MSIPTGLLLDLARQRRADLRRHDLSAEHRAIVRSTRRRPRTPQSERRTTY